MSKTNDILKIESDLILTDLVVTDRWEAIDRLSELLLKKGYVTDQYAAKTKEREEGFPTALPTEPVGVAIPHTWAEFCIEPAVAVAILKEPIPWIEMGTKDKLRDVQIVLALSITQPEKQVHFLKTIIDFFVKPENIENLLNNNGVVTIQKVLAEGLDLE
jgi:PTS system galactitol-specific IIA component